MCDRSLGTGKVRSLFYLICLQQRLCYHLHCICTLPEGDAKFSTRWRLIKSEFSCRCPEQYKQYRSASRLSKGEQVIWQRRFWEHQIRDETDFIQYVDSIHYNPVKHRLVAAPKDLLYSSFYRYVRNGAYTRDWGVDSPIEFDSQVSSE